MLHLILKASLYRLCLPGLTVFHLSPSLFVQVLGSHAGPRGPYLGVFELTVWSVVFDVSLRITERIAGSTR